MTTEREHDLADRLTEKEDRVEDLEVQLKIERALTDWLVQRYGPPTSEQYAMFKEFYSEYQREEEFK